MNHYQPSSELQRAAEQADRNERRIAEWRRRNQAHLEQERYLKALMHTTLKQVSDYHTADYHGDTA